jgi:phosphoserine phosphatase RsbU/P
MNVKDAHILVVDDIADNRDLLVRRLKRLGIEKIAEARDGSEALEAIARDTFDLVLLDIMMPGIGGVEVLERLRSEGRLAELPVLVISALTDIDSVVRCIELGAEDFISKPFNPTLLRARVLATLEKKFLRDLTRAELHRKRSELSEARILQMALKPLDFIGEFGRHELYIESILAPAMEVGGDIVDHFQINDRLWAFLVGDVSDKGAGAALVMARTHALFRTLQTRKSSVGIFENPEEAVRIVNATLSENNDRCMFVTAFFGVLDVETAQLKYVRAGHVEPFLLHADGSSTRLSAAGGLPLGIDENASYKSTIVGFDTGDELVVVTDGVTEAFDMDGNPYGEERLQDFMNARVRSTSLLGELLKGVRAFARGYQQSDDIAALHVAVHKRCPHPEQLRV